MPRPGGELEIREPQITVEQAGCDFVYNIYGQKATVTVYHESFLRYFGGIEAIGLVRDPHCPTDLERELSYLEPKLFKKLMASSQAGIFPTQSELKRRGVWQVIYQPITPAQEEQPATPAEVEEAYYEVFRRAQEERRQTLVLPLVVPVELLQGHLDLEATSRRTVILGYNRFLQDYIKGPGPASGHFPGKSPGRIFVLA